MKLELIVYQFFHSQSLRDAHNSCYCCNPNMAASHGLVPDLILVIMHQLSWMLPPRHG